MFFRAPTQAKNRNKRNEEKVYNEYPMYVCRMELKKMGVDERDEVL